jgi:UDP-N-acetylmuramate--alanine ligase
MNEFGRAFRGADVVVLTDIYGAGEEPIPDVTLVALSKSMRAAFQGELRVVHALDDIPAELARIAQAGDLILLLGAGSIGSVAPHVLTRLEQE